LPYFTDGWEELFVNLNDMGKAVFSLQAMVRTSEIKRKLWSEDRELSLISIPFEKFVIDPTPYMKKIEEALDTHAGQKTRKIMKKQNVPRKQLADSPALAIYKRCGWTPPSGASEQEELNSRRNFVAENASAETLVVIDQLSEEYEANYLSE